MGIHKEDRPCPYHVCPYQHSEDGKKHTGNPRFPIRVPPYAGRNPVGARGEFRDWRFCGVIFHREQTNQRHSQKRTDGDGSQPPAEQGWGLPTGEQRHCNPASQFRNRETFPVYGEMSAATVLSAAQVKAEGGRDASPGRAERRDGQSRTPEDASGKPARLCSRAPS